MTIPRLGYGAANLGNFFRVLSEDEAWEVLEVCWEAGIRYFDTAPHYGLGLSETRLGAFLRTKPRSEYVVSTKVGRLLRANPDDDGGLDLANNFHVRTDVRREWDVSAAGIVASLEESQQRMGLDRVDLVYLHDPERHDLELAIAEGLPALEQLRSEGKVAAIGVGSMTSQALERSVWAADLDAIMVAGRYTLLEQPAAVEVLPACRDTGTAVVAASVFNSGLLARSEPLRAGRYEYGTVPDALWEHLQEILAVCRNHGVLLPAAALQFPLRERMVRSVVIGSSRAKQVRENVELFNVEIPSGFWEELATLQRVIDEKGGSAC